MVLCFDKIIKEKWSSRLARQAHNLEAGGSNPPFSFSLVAQR